MEDADGIEGKMYFRNLTASGTATLRAYMKKLGKHIFERIRQDMVIAYFVGFL